MKAELPTDGGAIFCYQENNIGNLFHCLAAVQDKHIQLERLETL
jgi:hypothetical protein